MPLVTGEGWVLAMAGRVWRLLDSCGRVVMSVPAEYVAEEGTAALDAYAARLPRFRPPLVPGRPYVHCVLTGGPSGEPLHQYLDPDEAGAGPPELLLVRGQVYRVAVHCGHATCPVHYAAAEHTG